MLEFLSKLWSQLVEFGGSIPTGKKVAMATVALISMSSILAVAYFASKPDYKVLFAGLSPSDSTAITQKLTESGAPFQLAQEGSAILVPADRALGLRLEMATAGLPSGGVVGYEIFDKSTFGMTEFVQKLNFKRALQGELSRTINQFREVISSRVHIAIPEKRLFTEDESRVTASVVVKLVAGRRLKKDRVQGIVHLVASSVENLQPENVTVVDVDGNVLAGGESSDEMAMLSSTQLEYRSSVEKSLERQITSMLENVVGPGKVITRVNADINFRRVERTEKKFDPESQVARSEQRSESKSSGEQIPVGVPGVQSNIPGGEQAALAAKPATSSNTQETTNYEINEVTSHMVEQVGDIKRLSVAVVVDGKYEKTETGREFVPRTAEEINQLTALVTTAAGIKTDRGDNVVVESAPFDVSRFEDRIAEAKVEADRQLYGAIVQYAGIGALALVLFLFVARPIIKSITAANQDVEALRAFPRTVKEMEARYGMVSEEEVDYRQRVRQMIEQNPKTGAEMIRDWLRARR